MDTDRNRNSAYRGVFVCNSLGHRVRLDAGIGPRCLVAGLNKVRVTISSAGDEWPERIKVFTQMLEDEGFENTASGSADYSEALPDEPNPKKLWLVYDRKEE